MKYDLAVVGAGLGGLAAAALATRMNKRAIVLEPGDAVGGALGVFKKNDFTFHPGPTVSFGFERGGTLQQLHERLGIGQNASLRSPCYQVALPDRRITVYSEPSETLDEFRREFPQEIDRIAKFYHDVRKQAAQISKSPVSAFLSRRRTAAGFIRSYRFSDQFTAFLDVQSYYFFRRPVAALSLHSLITSCDSAPFTVPGGFGRLAEQIVDVLLKNGSEIRYRVPLADISIKSRGLSTPREEIEAGAVLLNTEPHRQKSTLCIGLKEEVVPVSMLSEVLGISDYAHPERFFTLSVGTNKDETTAPGGMRTLTATFSTVPNPQTIDDQKRQIASLIPFLNDFIVFAEECEPAEPRVYVMPEGTSFKTIRTPDNQSLLSRSSIRGVYMLFDCAGTPVQSITAAQKFIDYR